MASWSVRRLQRFPAREIANNLGSFGAVATKLYRAIDRNGHLSDFIADPRSATLNLMPRRIMIPLLRRSAGPLVSVIVATRNNAETITASLHSLLLQTHAHIEVIVVDDASDDKSCDLIRELVKEDSRVKLICNNRQRGTGYSRNLGLVAARGDYVTFQDGDDVSLPTRIAAQLGVFSKFQGKILSVCNYVRVDREGRSLELNDRRVMKCIISMMFPREIVLKRVGFFMDGTVSEDADYYERIKIAFGAKSEVLVFRTLYRALFRKNSSFFDQMKIETVEKGRVLYETPLSVSSAHEQVRTRHKLMRDGKISCRVEFDVGSSAKPNSMASEMEMVLGANADEIAAVSTI